MLFFCYLRNYLQNRSPHKYSGEASDTFRWRKMLCVYGLAGVHLVEDKLVNRARILLLLTLTSGCTLLPVAVYLRKEGRRQYPFPLNFCFYILSSTNLSLICMLLISFPHPILLKINMCIYIFLKTTSTQLGYICGSQRPYASMCVHFGFSELS